MAYNNYINLDETSKSQAVYRVFPVQRLLEMMQTRKNVLVKPKKWDDPFENALLSSAMGLPDGTICSFAAKNSVYGQCWTMHEETDAMWRIYSNDKTGVKIKTTISKLLDSLKNDLHEFWELRCFIGKVLYFPEMELFKKFDEVDLMNSNGSGIAETLLYKRIEFEHENEVRLIYSGVDNKCLAEILEYSIDPFDLIDEIVFDPRMPSVFVDAFKEKLSRLGYAKPIRQSSLYNPPRPFVKKL